MKFFFCSIFTLLCLHSFAQSNYAADLIPPALKARAAATIRNEETVIDMRAPDNVISTIKRAVTVYKESGSENARIIQYYNKNTIIKSIKGEIYNANGIQIGKFTQNDFKDESAVSSGTMFADYRVKHFLPNINVYPYTVVSYIELRDKQNLIIPDWTPNSDPEVSVEKSSFQFISRTEDKLTIKTQNYPGKAEENTNEKLKINTYTWLVNNINATKMEAYMPLWQQSMIKVSIAPENFNYYNRKGNYKNWNELGTWYYNQLLKDKRKLSPETTAAVNRLIAGVTDDKEKARILYNYMQTKTRYISIQVGIGGFEPFPAKDVDQLGYGDCKALVNYMQSLLDIAGIESYYCVVQAGSSKINFDPDYASMEQGNHIILCVPLKGDTTWLECTSQKIPFGFLSTFTDDRNVLACGPSGGKIIHTPKLTAEMNIQSRKGEFKLAADGTISGSMQTIFKGSQYDNHETAVYETPTEQEKLLKDYYTINNLEFEKIAYTQDKSLSPFIAEDLTISIRNYAPKTGDKIILKPNVFNIQPLIPENRNRIAPLYINRGFTDIDELTFTLPEGAELTLPEPVQFTNDIGLYKAKLSRNGNKITYSRMITVKDGTFKPESYSTFYKFITDVNNADALRMVIATKN